MSICQNGELGQHRWEYARTKDGGDVFICLNPNCGETLIEHLDCFGG